MKTIEIDSRRQIVIPGDKEQTIDFAVSHWLECATQAIEKNGYFTVALSGGSTPKAIFQRLAQKHKDSLNWNNVYLFWGDERAVPPSSSDSNYHMAMKESGLESLPLWDEHIFRMQAEKEIQQNALFYEEQVRMNINNLCFDLIMLGMGDDGHTASLFPNTTALKEDQRLVVANYIPQKECWRMTFTYPLINKAKGNIFYVIGENKASMTKKVLQGPYTPDLLPSQAIGTPNSPALWILDTNAASLLEV